MAGQGCCPFCNIYNMLQSCVWLKKKKKTCPGHLKLQALENKNYLCECQVLERNLHKNTELQSIINILNKVILISYSHSRWYCNKDSVCLWMALRIILFKKNFALNIQVTAITNCKLKINLIVLNTHLHWSQGWHTQALLGSWRWGSSSRRPHLCKV